MEKVRREPLGARDLLCEPNEREEGTFEVLDISSRACLARFIEEKRPARRRLRSIGTYGRVGLAIEEWKGR